MSRSYLTSVPAFLKRAAKGGKSEKIQKFTQTINVAIDEYESRANERLKIALAGQDRCEGALLREALERKRKQTTYKDILLGQMQLEVWCCGVLLGKQEAGVGPGQEELVQNALRTGGGRAKDPTAGEPAANGEDSAAP